MPGSPLEQLKKELIVDPETVAPVEVIQPGSVSQSSVGSVKGKKKAKNMGKLDKTTTHIIKKQKTSRPNNKLHPGDIVGIKDSNITTYQEYARLMALPEADRPDNAKNQSQMEKHLKIARETLWLWRQNQSFWTLVQRFRTDWGRSKTSEVVGGLVKRATQSGTRGEVELFMQLFEGYVPKRANLNVNTTLGEILSEIRGEGTQHVQPK